MTEARNIAIIGSGIAGLAAAWYLGARHRVTLYEKQPAIGMAAHGLEWGGARVDMPLRVLYRGYYPTLTALYADADIETVAADYSGSFSDVEGRCHFRYRNWQPWQRLSLPMLQGGQPLGARSRAIVRDLLRFYAGAGAAAKALRDSDVTLEEWLKNNKYSSEFIEDFILPVFAAIGTCTTQSVRRYPARVIVDYLHGGVLMQGVSRTRLGADHVAARLSSRCADIRLSAAITALEARADGLRISSAHGPDEDFEHVVVATQGNQARALTAAVDPQAGDVLQRFRYEDSRVIVHTDPALMPRRQRDWSPVNFFHRRDLPRPMASIWLNAVLPVDGDAPDAFQTWNPLREPAAAHTLAEAGFQRPVVDSDSEGALAALDQLHAQPRRRVWYCGSYAQAGVPLLESAARSALRVAEHIPA